MIDWTRVEELRDEIGPEDFAEVAELFLRAIAFDLRSGQAVENAT